MSESFLLLKKINKKFNNNFSIEDVDLDLRRGEVHALIGENGAGKSALMKIVSGFFPWDSGEIILNGQKVTYNSIWNARQQGILYQHQDHPLFGNLSVAENLFFHLDFSKTNTYKLYDQLTLKHQCLELFKELNISIDPEIPASQLVFSEKQLLFAARAYLIKADINIFDEPTAAMNDYERHVFFEILQRIKLQSKGIFYITHRLDEIPYLCDRVSVISKGQITAETEDMSLAEEDFIRLLIGHNEKHKYPRTRILPQKKVLLEVKHLTSLPRLKNINLRLYKQEILGIAGMMGAGRSDLGKCLFGEKMMEKGEIIIEGKSCAVKSPRDALASGISLIPDDRISSGLFVSHDLLKNMALGNLQRFSQNQVIDNNLIEKLVIDYIKKFGINPGKTDDVVQYYSGGNQQKVLLARWFMHRSLIYIMDEPTRGIDTPAKVDIYNAMNNLVAHGASVLLISSDVDELLGMSDRILVVAGGKIRANVKRKDASKELIYRLAGGT